MLASDWETGCYRSKCTSGVRLKHNEYVQLEDDIWLELSALGLAPGSSLYFKDVSVTKQKGFGPFNLAAKWKRKYQGYAADEGWFILTNLAEGAT